MHRHGRQARLAEVGEAGQGRIRQARVDVCADGWAGEVAVRYLAGAGVGGLRVTTAELAALALSIDPAIEVVVDADALAESTPGNERVLVTLRDPVAQQLMRGASLALWELRAALWGGTG